MVLTPAGSSAPTQVRPGSAFTRCAGPPSGRQERAGPCCATRAYPRPPPLGCPPADRTMEGAGPAGPATGAATGHAPTPAHERRRVPSKPLADGSQLGYIAWVSVESASRMVGHPQARAARRAELQRELGRDYHMASWRCTGPAPVAICTAVLMARLSDGGGWSGAGRAGALGATTPGQGTGRRAHATSDRPERFRICTRLLGSLDLSLNILQLRRRSRKERPATVRTYRNILSGRVHCREAGRLHSEQATSVVALPLSPSVRPQRGSRASRRRARAATATDRDSTAEPPSDPDPTSETRRRADPPGPLSRGG